jgi:hydrophobic/amphiphilic exporter-1 (mainly G- bacteria), HAE1 family
VSGRLVPGAQVRPIPSLDLGNPEMQVTPNRDRLNRVNMTTSQLGVTVSAMVDGTVASNYRLFGDEIDLVVKSEAGTITRTQDMAKVPIITPAGEKVTLGSLADIRLEEGPTQINHLDSQRAIVIQVIPPQEIALETAMDEILEKVVNPIKTAETSVVFIVLNWEALPMI